MCLSDNWVKREFNSTTYTKVLGATAAEIVSPSPYRVGLIFSAVDIAAGGVGRVTPSPSGTGGWVIESTSVFSDRRFDWDHWAPVLQKSWFGISAGGVTISVTELILPSEFWPIFLGIIPVPKV